MGDETMEAAGRLPRFLGLFRDLLERTSSPSVLPFLTYGQRFGLVCDLLLGHPLVRGGARPRDYPMGHTRRLTVETAALLASTPGWIDLRLPRSRDGWEQEFPDAPDTAGERQRDGDGCLPRRMQCGRALAGGPAGGEGDYWLHDWVLAVRLLALARGASGAAGDVPTPSAPDAGALLAHLWDGLVYDLAAADHVCPVMPSAGDRPDPKTALAAAYLTYLRARDAGLSWLGFNRSEVERCLSGDAGRVSQLARSAATLCATVVRLCRSEQGRLRYLRAGEEERVEILEAALLERSRATTPEQGRRAGHREGPQSRQRDEKCREQYRRGVLEPLRDARMALLTLKAKGIQRMLGLARREFVQRGVSAWCSQTGARLRDHLLEAAVPGTAGVLQCDSDAEVAIALPPTASLDRVEALARRFLAEMPGAGRGIHEAYPRLDGAVLQAAAEGIASSLPHPDVSVEVAPVTMLDLAIACREKTEPPGLRRCGRRGELRPTERRIRNRILLPEGGGPPGSGGIPEAARCSGIAGQRAFLDPAYRLPDWLQTARDEGKEKYGYAAWCYLLAGTAWRLLTTRGIVEELERSLAARGSTVRIAPQTTRKRLVRAWDASSYYLVRMDATGLGRLFLGTPRLRGAGYSHAVEGDLASRWLRAVLSVVETRIPPAHAPHGCPPAIPLPIDLLYFGGDDLQFAIPTSAWPQFWTALAQGAPSTVPGMEGLSYRVGAVEIALQEDAMDDAFQRLAHACLKPLLEVARGAGEVHDAIVGAPSPTGALGCEACLEEDGQERLEQGYRLRSDLPRGGAFSLAMLELSSPAATHSDSTSPRKRRAPSPR